MVEQPHPASNYDDAQPSTRARWLKRAGFDADPFRFQVTEQFWAKHHAFETSSERSSAWLENWHAYFVRPRLVSLPDHQPAGDSAAPVVLVGDAGSGKTALLYEWMSTCSRTEHHTLVVLYDITELHDAEYRNSGTTYQEIWLRSLATALVLYILSSCGVSRRVALFDWLTILVNEGGQLLRQFLDHLLKGADARQSAWKYLRRPLFEPVELTPELRQQLQAVVGHTTRFGDAPPTGRGLLYENFAPICEALEIRRVALYMDNLSAESFALQSARANLVRLLRTRHLLHLQVHVTLTLPPSLLITWRHWLDQLDEPLETRETAISWGEDALRALLVRRCQVAGDSSLETLAETGLAPQLEQHVVRQSENSPRRLLFIVSALMDAQAATDPQSPTLTRNAWEWMCRHWTGEGDAPRELPLPNNSDPLPC